MILAVCKRLSFVCCDGNSLCWLLHKKYLWKFTGFSIGGFPYWYPFLFSILKCHNRSFESYGSSKIHTKPNCLSEFKRLSKDIEKIHKSRNRFHIFMIVKVHGLSMGNSMVIKTDEIKAENGNYNKTKYDNNIIRNSISKPSWQNNTFTE